VVHILCVPIYIVPTYSEIRNDYFVFWLFSKVCTTIPTIIVFDLSILVTIVSHTICEVSDFFVSTYAVIKMLG